MIFFLKRNIGHQVHYLVSKWTYSIILWRTSHSNTNFTHCSWLLSLYQHLSRNGHTFAKQGQQKLAVTRRFVFDALAIDNLKNTIEDSSDSRVVVVMSLIWKLRFLQELISSAKNGQSIAINLRGKSNIPPLKHALGKFTMSEIANLKASLSRKDELNDFVKLVGNTIRDTCVRQALIDDISSLVVNNKIKLVQKLCQGDVYSCSSLCGFPADFGSGWA